MHHLAFVLMLGVIVGLIDGNLTLPSAAISISRYWLYTIAAVILIAAEVIFGAYVGLISDRDGILYIMSIVAGVLILDYLVIHHVFRFDFGTEVGIPIMIIATVAAMAFRERVKTFFCTHSVTMFGCN